MTHTPQTQLDLFSDLAPAPVPQPRPLPPVTAKALAALSEAKRAEVEATVNRYYHNCRVQGAEPEQYKYIVAEAIDLARRGDTLDAPLEAHVKQSLYDPRRSYGQYKSPTVEAF